MDSDSDEYDKHLESWDFSPEELSKIDSEVQTELAVARVAIRLEEYDSPSPKMTPRSLVSLFRKKRLFSVSDLSQPSWCQVQYDYGLRQKRSRPLKDRPASFRAASGKEITVDTDTAAQNYRTTQAGRKVHKALEREVHGKEIVVQTANDEERWALRFLNLVQSLRILMDTGYTREIPVFGMYLGELVVGCIDEIVRAPVLDDSQTPSESLSQSILAQPAKDRGPTHTLSIRDTKTRRKNSLPIHDDTLPSRLQLMLYHRLLSDLLSPSFDFPMFWQQLKVDPQRPFSSLFMEDALQINTENAYLSNLSCFEHVWRQVVDALNVTDVQPVLKLIYRRQPQPPDETVPVESQAADDLASSEDLDLQMAIHQSLQGPGFIQQPEYSCSANQSPSPAKGPFQSDIIGCKDFVMDDAFLNTHVSAMLDFWYGRRSPEGVSLSNATRCNFCEYRESCEWRQQQTGKFAERQNLSRANSSTNSTD